MHYVIRWVVMIWLYLAATTAVAQAASDGSVDDYPSRPVRLVIPFTAGGGNDAIARILAQKLTETWKQQVVGDNRVGANGIIGTGIVAKARADGYTLLLVSTSFTINPAVHKLPYDPIRDFAPVALAASAPIILASSPAFPARTIQELIALAKTKPGQLQYASTGIGGGNHLAGELFQKLARISLLHVPYKGGSEAATDVMTGRVALMFSSVPVVLSHIKNGKLRGLGIGDTKRSNLLPDVPTIAQAGVAGYEAGFWFGVMVPGGTPKAIVRRINSDINRSLDSEDVQQRVSALGMEVLRSSPEDFARVIASDIGKWGRIIRDIGLGAR